MTRHTFVTQNSSSSSELECRSEALGIVTSGAFLYPALSITNILIYNVCRKSYTVRPGWLVTWLRDVYGEAVVITIYDVLQMETVACNSWKQIETTLKTVRDALS